MRLTGLPNRTPAAGPPRPHAIDQARGMAMRAARSRCCSWTWTVSSWSTTASATRPATSCWSKAARRIASTVRGNDTGGAPGRRRVRDPDRIHRRPRRSPRIWRSACCARSASRAGSPGAKCSRRPALASPLWHPRYRNGDELLRDADAAMYRAKAAGRDRCAVFDEAMREEAMRILDLEADLRRAINGDDFVAVLPADRAPRRPRRDRPRGAVALAPRAPRPARCPRVHRPGRGQRADRGGRLDPVRAGGRTNWRAAARVTSRSTCRRGISVRPISPTACCA